MKFAICNETFQDWPFDRAFAFARECGYTGLEFAPFTIANDVRDITAAQRQEVVRQAAAADLEIIGLHWLLAKTEGYYLTSPDAEVRRKTANYVKQLAQLCADLGGKVMVFGSPLQRNLLPGISHEQAMLYAAEVFREAMPELERLDVTLALEPLGPADGNFLLTSTKGIELAKLIDSPNCRLHLDVRAMSTEDRPIEETIRASADYAVHFHANDPNKQGPGMGDVDFVPIFRTLQEVGYQGWVSVEVFDYTPGVERLARESIDYMKRCLAQL